MGCVFLETFYCIFLLVHQRHAWVSQRSSGRGRCSTLVRALPYFPCLNRYSLPPYQMRASASVERPFPNVKRSFPKLLAAPSPFRGFVLASPHWRKSPLRNRSRIFQKTGPRARPIPEFVEEILDRCPPTLHPMSQFSLACYRCTCRVPASLLDP